MVTIIKALHWFRPQRKVSTTRVHTTRLAQMNRRFLLIRLFVAVVLGAVVYSTVMATDNMRSDYAVELSADRILHPTASAEPSYQCHHHSLGGLLVADSDGFVCERFALDARSHCCDPHQDRERHSCFSCTRVQQLHGRICCEWYEYCISCCLYASTPAVDYNQTLGQFEACAHTCRTGSSTLDQHGQYANSTHRYCLPHAKAVAQSPSASPSPSVSPSVLPDHEGVIWVHL